MEEQELNDKIKEIDLELQKYDETIKIIDNLK